MGAHAVYKQDGEYKIQVLADQQTATEFLNNRKKKVVPIGYFLDTNNHVELVPTYDNSSPEVKELYKQLIEEIFWKNQP